MDRHMDTAEVVTTLYRFLLGREPDLEGLASHRAALNGGRSLEEFMTDMARSEEFRARLYAFVRSVD